MRPILRLAGSVPRARLRMARALRGSGPWRRATVVPATVVEEPGAREAI